MAYQQGAVQPLMVFIMQIHALTMTSATQTSANGTGRGIRSSGANMNRYDILAGGCFIASIASFIMVGERCRTMLCEFPDFSFFMAFFLLFLGFMGLSALSQRKKEQRSPL